MCDDVQRHGGQPFPHRRLVLEVQAEGVLGEGMDARAVPVTEECVNVTFQLRKSSHFAGEKVFLSGNRPVLGAWAREKMVEMATSETMFPVWSATGRRRECKTNPKKKASQMLASARLR